MRTAFLLIISCLLLTGLSAQKNTSLLFTYAKVNNHYRFHEVFNVSADPNEIMIFPQNDYMGVGVRHRTTDGHIFSLSVSGNLVNRGSLKVNVPYEERNMPSYDIRSGGLQLRLEYAKLWSIPNHKPLRIGFTTAVSPRITAQHFSPVPFDKFPGFFMSYEAAATVGPQFSYSINNRFIANFKLPVDIFNYYFLDVREENPNLPFGTQDFTRQKFYALLLKPAFSFSVGYFIFHEERKANNNTF